MEALKWLDGVSESARDQRAAVERNSPPGRYTAATSAHVFLGFPSRSDDLSSSSKAVTKSFLLAGRILAEQVTRATSFLLRRARLRTVVKIGEFEGRRNFGSANHLRVPKNWKFIAEFIRVWNEWRK